MVCLFYDEETVGATIVRHGGREVSGTEKQALDHV